MRWLHRGSTAALLVALCLVAACGSDPDYRPTHTGGTKKLGEKCIATNDCIFGLECSGRGVCANPGDPGTTQEGKDCSTYVDCLRYLTCAAWGKCIISGGTNKEGQACLSHDQCTKELVCSGAKTCAKRGSKGAADYGDACTAPSDCTMGLVCVSGKYQGLDFWAGAACKGKDTGPVRALFRVPRTGKKVNEFSALPSPNDIRKKDGKVYVADHPNPKGSIPSPRGEVVADLLKVISEDVTGYALNGTVFLRTSSAINFKTLTQTGKNATLQFINITKGSTGYGKSVAATTMYANSSRGKYICENSISVRPRVGSPLSPKQIYAVMLRRGLKDGAGNAVIQDDDFKVMLASSAPSNADLKKAWDAYKPLRTYLTDKNIEPGTVLSAAVFTTMDTRGKVAKFRNVVASQGPDPKLKNEMRCDGKLASPCADPNYPTHTCPAHPDPAHDEVQATIELPRFQSGTRPYTAAKDGGGVSYDASGNPFKVNTAKVCVSMTIPKAPMPQNGWPVVIYAHDTDGHYRTYVENGVAKNLRTVTDPVTPANTSKNAVISIGGVLNGPRRGSPGKTKGLFFNPANMRASRDNVYQGMADLMQVVRVIKKLDWQKSQSPTGNRITFDPKKIRFFGHGQGAVVGMPFVASDPDVQSVALAGVGGYLIGSLLEKTKPINVAGTVYLAMADPFVGSNHPVLNLMQLAYDEVDPLNYAMPLFRKTEAGMSPKHVFMAMGLGDGYTPLGTQKALAWVMNLRQMKQEAQRCGDKVCSGSETCSNCSGDCGSCLSTTDCGDGTCASSKGETCRNCPGDCGSCPPEFSVEAAPVKGNVLKPGKKVTAALVQYVGDGTYDDHFVVFRDPDAKHQSSYFLGSANWDPAGTPTIPKSTNY